MKRSITIQDIQLGESMHLDSPCKKIIRIKVDYRIGGMNYFTASTTPRGYYISVQPLEVGEHFESFMAFSGVAQILEPANRYSDKKLDAIAESIKSGVAHQDTMKQLLDYVKEKNHIE